MANEIKCGKCGSKNPLTSIFCIECGEKIDFSKVKPSDISEEGGGGIRFIGRLVRLCISIAIIGAAGLCLWPRSPTGAIGDEVAQKEGRMKMARLHDAAANGLEFTGGVAENEINAYLSHLLQKNQGNAAGGGSADLDQVNIDIGEEVVSVIAIASLGMVQVSYMLQGLPESGENGFYFAVQRAELGHLPLPGPGQAWVEKRMKSIFAGMEPELNVLDRAAAFRLKDEKLWIKIRGH